jgi:hypothetical protein
MNWRTGFENGARWQHSQDRERIGLAESVKAEYCTRMQDYAESVTVFAAEVKELEARLAKRERMIQYLREELGGEQMSQDDFKAKGYHSKSEMRRMETMTQAGKRPREWHLFDTGGWKVAQPHPPANHKDEYVHVVEYAAYRKAIEGLKRVAKYPIAESPDSDHLICLARETLRELGEGVL